MDIIISNPIPSSPSKVNSTLLSSDAKKRQMSKKKDTKVIFCYINTNKDDFNLYYLTCIWLKKRVNRRIIQYRKKKLDKYMKDTKTDPLIW